MAKCVVCKAENAALEAERHPNNVTLSTAKALCKRANETDRREQPYRFCEKHLQSQPKVQAVNNGTEVTSITTTNVTPILKEETTNGKSI